MGGGCLKLMYHAQQKRILLSQTKVYIAKFSTAVWPSVPEFVLKDMRVNIDSGIAGLEAKRRTSII
jgi:hypothetical protein